LFAGTTEGLWRSMDGGASWHRVTPADWSVNGLVVSEATSGRLIVGTQKLGLLVSEDWGQTFRAANDGFNHRRIISLALDSSHPARVLAVLADAPEPLLATDDGGHTWKPLGPGLRMESLRGIYASPGGWWAALERGGLMRYDPARGAWASAGMLVGDIQPPSEPSQPLLLKRRNPPPASVSKAQAGPRPVRSVVDDMAFAEGAWYAATQDALLVSRDQGSTWRALPFGLLSLPTRSVRVSADGLRLWAVSLRGIVFSLDGGHTWSWRDLPVDAGGALHLDAADDSTFFAIGNRALYVSIDSGRNWKQAGNGLPQVPIQQIAVVAGTAFAAVQSGGIYYSRDRGSRWDRLEGTLADAFFPALVASASSSTVFAASSTDGLYAVDFSRGSSDTASSASPGTPHPY
ncbi:MAG TPA: YCF48-related protein, partial [Candidatus Acidoferrales bacterium]|nr:YCF48-related protein [Candidatus Acidoferrales bacterium]